MAGVGPSSSRPFLYPTPTQPSDANPSDPDDGPMSNNYDYDLDALESEFRLMDDLDYEVGGSDDLDAALGLNSRTMALARAPSRLSLAAPPRRTLAGNGGGGGSSNAASTEQLRNMIQTLVQHQKAMAAAHKKMAQELKLQKLSAASTAGEVP